MNQLKKQDLIYIPPEMSTEGLISEVSLRKVKVIVLRFLDSGHPPSPLHFDRLHPRKLDVTSLVPTFDLILSKREPLCKSKKRKPYFRLYDWRVLGSISIF